MTHGPVTSGYPGKYVCFAMAAFCVTLAWRSLRIAMRTIREQGKSVAQGIFFKPEAKKSVGANVAIALMATFLLATLLAAIYNAWPN
jgi:hypothetical protein